MDQLNKQQLWETVLGDLELSLSKANFKTWFQNTKISRIEDDGQNIIVAVPNAFTQNWLEKKYHKAILNALQEATDNQIKKVSYRVEALHVVQDEKKDGIDLSKLEKQEKPDFNRYGLNLRYTFDSFVVGAGNELAHAACMAAVKYSGKKYNPLFIYGGVGLGKTHLLQAVGNEVLNNDSKKRILYTDAERFTNEFIQAIRNKTMNQFRKSYRDLDVLLIDDIQFMAGKEGTQEEFFHTFNNLHQSGRQIVITSDRTPKEIPALEDRLVSRLEWGLIVDVSPPKLETRIAILKTKCQAKKVSFSKEIIQYLASQIQDNVRELEGALNKLIAYQELHRSELDLPAVKNILNSLAKRSKKGFIQSKQVLETVANFYGVRISEMTSSSRRRELVIPRQAAMYLLREEVEASFPMIGKELGGRDHTTAMHAYKKLQKGVKEGGRIKQEIDLIKQRLYNQ